MTSLRISPNGIPAMICYTSATTGDPKGVVYSHRAILLHTYAVAVTFGASEADCILHIVPMFHANAWCGPFAAVGAGCKQVLPGREVINMEKLCQHHCRRKGHLHRRSTHDLDAPV